MLFSPDIGGKGAEHGVIPAVCGSFVTFAFCVPVRVVCLPDTGLLRRKNAVARSARPFERLQFHRSFRSADNELSALESADFDGGAFHERDTVFISEYRHAEIIGSDTVCSDRHTEGNDFFRLTADAVYQIRQVTTEKIQHTPG